MNRLINMAVQAAVGLLVCGTAFAAGPVGRVIAASGGVMVQRGQQTINAQDGTVLLSGDSVVTTDNGSAQWVMADDTVFAMGASSGLKINDFAMPNEQDRAGRADYTLIQGAVKTITGKIGAAVASNSNMAGHLMNAALLLPRSPAYFRKVAATKPGGNVMKTAVAAISALKATYAVAQTTAGGVEGKVDGGVLDVSNTAGSAAAHAGQYFSVPCATCKPVVSDTPPAGFSVIATNLDLDLSGISIDNNINISNPITLPPLPPGKTGPPTPVSPN